MSEVDDWTLKGILTDFHLELKSLEEKDLSYSEKDKKEESLLDNYIHLIRLAFQRKEFGDLMTVENFERCCRDGLFINYDGIGYYLDYDGNELGYVDCRDKVEDWPDKAAFVAWYNK